MNVYDSNRILQVLRPLGFVQTDDPTFADLILLNTCAVREKPERKVLSTLARLKPLKEANPDLILGVCGCVAQEHGKALLEKVPYLDLVVGPDRIESLPEILAQVERGERLADVTRLPREDYRFIKVDPEVEEGPTAFLTVMKGCDKVCSFCIVPYVRGREVSKPVDLVLAEARRLVEHGIAEITLLGQNVNSYGRDLPEGPDFPRLLHLVANVPGLKRLRFVTSHPQDADEAMMRAFAEIPILGAYLHLPIQSGSDRILKAMRRGYTVSEYLKKIELARTYCPDIALSTDIIVGFPGETVEDFEETLKVLSEVRFDTIFSFKYSPRPHTPAARLKDDVPQEEKARRLSVLQAFQDEITKERMERFLGRVEEVLVEGPSRLDQNEWMGRMSSNFIVNFKAPPSVRPGDMVRVRVEQVMAHCFKGSTVEE